MDRFADILRIATAILGVWSAISVLVAFPVAALFRAQARREVLWRQAERRRVWIEAVR
ncbi:MAG TPA: hypothetical protein VEB43_00875 [Anaeromyxobacter sp.]|nr:hypothetical protein [Anaeromyxobacter sp.]